MLPCFVRARRARALGNLANLADCDIPLGDATTHDLRKTVELGDLPGYGFALLGIPGSRDGLLDQLTTIKGLERAEVDDHQSTHGTTYAMNSGAQLGLDSGEGMLVLHLDFRQEWVEMGVEHVWSPFLSGLPIRRGCPAREVLIWTRV